MIVSSFAIAVKTNDAAKRTVAAITENLDLMI